MSTKAYRRFDYTQWGTGLQSQGLPLDPTKVYDFYKQVAAQGPSTAYNKGILSGVSKYAKHNPGSTSDPLWVTNALDWYWRDIQRKSQKENGFFASTLGKVLGTVAKVGLGFVPGVGPALSAGFGALQGGLTGGIGGALLGGLGGYGAGQLGQGLSGAFSGAGGLSTLLKAPGTFASNLGRNTLTSLQNFLPGYGGSLTGTGGALSSLPGAASLAGRAGSAAAGGSGSMGFFSDLLKGSLPNIIGGGISYLGQMNAQDSFNKIAQQLAQQSQFSPYNISGPSGSVAFNGNNVTASLSPELQAQLGQMDKATRGAFEDYMKFNAGGYADNYYSTIKNMQQPTDQAMTNDLLDRVYASGNWGSTIGAKDIYSYQQSKALEDQMLRLQAQQAGAAEQDRLFNRYFKSAASTQTLAQSPYDLISLGGNLGTASSGAAASAAQYPWLAAGTSANASSAFWSFLGGSAYNAVGSVLQKYGNYQKEANRPVYTPSPYFSGGNSTMTWR